MAQTREIYGDVESKADMSRIFNAIRKEIHEARSRPALTELYKRAGYLITLTHAPAWRKKFGKEATALRKTGQEEFHKTAKEINQRAAEIGTAADYDETWGKGD
jgi:hypothetical protein